jgi:hypothetical protein
VGKKVASISDLEGFVFCLQRARAIRSLHSLIRAPLDHTIEAEIAWLEFKVEEERAKIRALPKRTLSDCGECGGEGTPDCSCGGTGFRRSL